MKIERSIPYFKILLKSTPAKRMTVLDAFPEYVIDDLMEVLVNLVRGTLKVKGEKLRTLRRYRTPLLNLVNSKNKKVMRKVFYKQKGAFLASLIPVIISALGGIISSRLGK